MKPLPSKAVIKILKNHGFVLSRQSGSHMIFTHPENGIMVPVPVHSGNKPIHLGTFLAIIKQSKIEKQNFHL
jgi:predicted RNA binding protein YcfA (HicA-like mRNA interferase family)